ncbi:MAG TPA: hypothetical protein VFA07_08930 [Chthonomonadaceae bacterium]|nr:hypothetical protein [Chthonomonadaceae bacterium]
MKALVSDGQLLIGFHFPAALAGFGEEISEPARFDACPNDMPKKRKAWILFDRLIRRQGVGVGCTITGAASSLQSQDFVV